MPRERRLKRLGLGRSSHFSRADRTAATAECGRSRTEVIIDIHLGGRPARYGAYRLYEMLLQLDLSERSDLATWLSHFVKSVLSLIRLCGTLLSDARSPRAKQATARSAHRGCKWASLADRHSDCELIKDCVRVVGHATFDTRHAFLVHRGALQNSK